MSAARALYLRALDPEGPLPLDGPDTSDIQAALAATEGEFGAVEADELEDLVSWAKHWSAAETQRFRDQLTGADEDSAVRCVLLNAAPLALSAGAWLQWMTSSANGDTALALEVLALYAADIGVGYPHADRGSAYRAMLDRHRITTDTTGVRLAGSDQIESFSFRFPALLLSMSRLPDRYFPEILGADLFLRSVGVIPPLAALPATVFGATNVAELDLGGSRSGDTASALDRSLAAARLLLDNNTAGNNTAGNNTAASSTDGNSTADGNGTADDCTAVDDRGPRFRRGFQWAAQELGAWCARLRRETALTRYPDYEIWRLIFSRARQAAVYHARYQLAGRPLAEWFADVDAGPRPFLDALASSRLIRPGRPDQSPLVGGLIGEKGPMFRVFTDNEVAVIRRWISGLPEDGSVPPSENPSENPSEDRREDRPDSGHDELVEAQRSWHRQGQHIPGRATVAPQVGEAGKPESVRAAFHTLLNRADSTGIRRFAHGYATRWLTRSQFGLAGAEQQIPRRWDRESGLRGWLEAEHDRHSEQFSGQDVAIPSRAELIESTLQLAPLIMIDGGWLQGFTDYRLASSPAGQFLFRTYWDELGNGDCELNHPRIYRNLLRQMGHELPPIESREFAAWSGFLDRSFALPVYWLSISRFPQTFQPEILGLNLAMELSGVGGSYRTARIALRKYKFSTQFVDLHNTIDNVATGHSAWAADAIDNYMAEIPSILGQGQENQTWDRIRVGYRSLNPPDSLAAGLYTTLRSRSARKTGHPSTREN
ncbi:MAG TPA: iron-containing redox enzyme family protein [Pseudonocardiaceae bacterium]|nr:iron-containing redox enzyme family protein [Pseudonocardiaceae bacterium]